MGKLSFDEAQEIAKSKEQQGDIGFFTLKNHKDMATVRFLHNGLKDIETLAIHFVRTKDGKNKAVSCVRGPKDPIDDCPLCANARQGEEMSVRYYIHLLQYKKNEQGEYVGEHKVFDRGSSFIKQLESYAGRYNPLSKIPFDIERIGEAKSRETSYNIIPLSADDNDKYPYYEDDLEWTPALGTLIPEKTPEQLDFFVKNGYFKEDAEKDSKTESSDNYSRAAAPAPARSYDDAAPRRREEAAPVSSALPRRRV